MALLASIVSDSCHSSETHLHAVGGCKVGVFLAAAAMPHQQLAEKQQELVTVCAAPALHLVRVPLCLLLLALLAAVAAAAAAACPDCCCCRFVLQVPPVLNQFVTRALDKNQAETLFKLMLKYRCGQQPHQSSTLP